MADWVTISSIGTAGGTLVLAGATFASVRSANRASRVAERSLLAAQRPLLMPSRLQDPAQKIGFADGKWVSAAGGLGVAEASSDAIYLAISVRNVGTGMAVLHGWHFHAERALNQTPPGLEEHQRLSRDLYIPAGDIGFWQGTFRDPEAPEFSRAARTIDAREPFMVDVLYGDHEGGQRAISRFVLNPREDGQWLATVARHWNVDRPDPR